MSQYIYKQRSLILAGLIIFGTGVLLGIYIPIQSPLVAAENQYESNSLYHFINPLLVCGGQDFSRIQDGKILDLKAKINTYIASQKKDAALDTASVYFRELNGGQFFSINPDLQFVPASLLKVPLAMSIYRRAEIDPNLLEEKIFFPGSSLSASEYFTAPAISASSTYRVEDLIDSMVENSDNDASLLLTHVISTVELGETYSNLGVMIPQDEKYVMTVTTYAGFFRVLYNATYLGHTASEHLLELLSHSFFKKGIVAGVPKKVVVAHKFGERGFDDPEVPNQLHDCGIVYTKNPYLLCVMTQGNNYEKLAVAISEISKMIYAYAGP
jgi:beta-lactamase class A